MRGNLYNNYISFSFSFCPSSRCDSNSDTHYPGLIFFSYPNGTDTNIDLINEMINTNKKIDSITINLKNQVRIDNNIFGLEYYDIQIVDIKDCGSIAFISSEKISPLKKQNAKFGIIILLQSKVLIHIIYMRLKMFFQMIMMNHILIEIYTKVGY